MHWNGAYLTREQGGFESPQLLSIHGSSASDVWTGGLATLVRKVGDALFPTELTLGSFTGLHAVAGGTIFGTTSDGRIIQADGMNISELCPGPTRLNGIDLFDQDHIWAIGNAGRVVRRTPNGCTGVSLPGGNLHGVYALAADTIFAVGDNGGLFRVASNSAGTNFQIGQGTLAPANLLGISGSRPDNVWIVGENGTVLHLDTTTGNYKSLGDLLPNSKSVAFRGVWASHELDSNGQLKHRDAWIVGDYGTMILARALGTGDVSTVRYQLVRQYSGTDLNLNAVWGSGPGDVWAVGDFGAVLHYVPPATELP